MKRSDQNQEYFQDSREQYWPYHKVIILHSIKNSETLAQISQLKSSPRLSNLLFEHHWVLDSTSNVFTLEQLLKWNTPRKTLYFQNSVVSPVRDLYENSDPDLLIIHCGLLFQPFWTLYIKMYDDLKKSYPNTAIGFEGAHAHFDWLIDVVRRSQLPSSKSAALGRRFLRGDFDNYPEAERLIREIY